MQVCCQNHKWTNNSCTKAITLQAIPSPLPVVYLIKNSSSIAELYHNFLFLTISDCKFSPPGGGVGVTKVQKLIIHKYNISLSSWAITSGKFKESKPKLSKHRKSKFKIFSKNYQYKCIIL